MKSNCFHCGDKIPHDVDLHVQVDDEQKAVCCIGCKTVAETILAGGFEQYYKFRSENPDKPDFNPSSYTEYDQQSVQAEFVIQIGTDSQADLAIDGMHCAACAWLIEQRLVRVKGVNQIKVNAASNRAKVTWDPDTVKLSEIFAAIADIGYQAFPFKINEQEARFRATNKSFLKRIAVAALMSMQIMMLAFAMYTGVLEKEYDTFFRWVSLLLCTPIIAYSAYPIIYSAIRAILNKSVNMDVPVAFALVGIFIASAYATVTLTGEVYYESISMFTLFLLAGRYLEHNVKAKAASITANMLKLIPLVATKKQGDELLEVAANSLVAGDLIVVKEGCAIPADGHLQTEQAYIDESMLTGESEPVKKQKGDMVFAGSLVTTTTIQLNVSATGAATTLSQMATSEGIQTSESSFVSVSDTVSKYFVLFVLVIAVVTFTGWQTLTDENGFWPMIAVLVATCPCALSLAMPTAMTAMTAGLKKHGILVNNSNALEKIPSLAMLGFDKTGTLTEGQLILERVKLYDENRSEQEVLEIIKALEVFSSHPIASAFKNIDSELVADDIKNVAGQGMEGCIRGKVYQVGNLSYVTDKPDNIEPDARLYLGVDNNVIAAVYLSDPIRQEASAAITGIPCDKSIISGDSVANVEPVAASFSIPFHGALKPDDKVNVLDNYRQQAQGRPVGMVGDGINDAMVLESADVSIAVANATDLSKQKAHVILLGGQLDKIPHLFSASKQLNRIIRQNLAWAAGYNLCVLPLAMFGILTPYAAVAGMSLSSVLVVVNSTRLLKL
ncbi:cadmium-translocating P-type ATPase [Catenovulum sp. SM1970]|uniref:heavy metal translocating P-type ATPase n=1 Tax=Marinifaba aquimaris TaxID=2741323 RepID=UPI001571EE88|nr:heavy metal translocating P-type ATPase [Marinifaba aquimaris]NTS77305.1 cadmium-translocating P-type ATPase [Marinifaba aquimaris]